MVAPRRRSRVPYAITQSVRCRSCGRSFLWWSRGSERRMYEKVYGGVRRYAPSVLVTLPGEF